MLHRKVNQKVLFWNTLAYRVCVTVETFIFMWLVAVMLEAFWGITMTSAAGGIIVAVSWNAVNMLTYWVWHYYFFKWFHVGAGLERAELADKIAQLRAKVKDLSDHVETVNV